jgi:hypothetical protein
LTSQSQAAAGKDFQNAIDPATGQLDPSRLNMNLHADPAAARAAIAASQAGQSNVQTVLANSGMSQEQAFGRMKFIGDALGTKLASGQPVK